MLTTLVELLPLFMFVALAVLVFSSYPIAFILGGLAVAFGLLGWLAGLFEPIEFYNFLGRIWFIAENMVIIAVPCFVFMGVMLEKSEIAHDLLESIQALLGHVPGGLAMSVTVMGTVIAAITGIIGASVVIMTLIALPTMLRNGYSPPLALGTIAASSTLGILIPPSILLVFMIDMLNISEGVLFAAALFPGLLLAGLYIAYIAIYSALVPSAAPRVRRDDRSRADVLRMVLRGIVPPLGLIGVILGSIFTGFTTVTESAAVGALGATGLAAARGKLGWGTLNQVLQRSALMIGMVFFLFVGATSFAYVFRVLGGDELVLGVIDYTGFGSVGILAITILAVFAMGFIFDVLEIMLIVIPLFAPIVTSLDFAGHVNNADIVYWFAILVAITLQTSFLTPPMGLALFYIKGVAPPSVRMQQIYVGIIPFVALQMLCVLLVAWWPGIAMWLPRALFGD